MSWKYPVISTLALAVLALGKPAGARSDRPGPSSAQAQRLIAMTPEDFERSATLKDDALETAATITTRPGWRQKNGLLRIVGDDGFFRAFIDKRSGKTRFQVYHAVHYRDWGWAKFKWVNYETPDGPRTAPVRTIGRIKGPCRRGADCPYVEHMGFEVGERLLRDVASRYRPGQAAAWRYRLKAMSGIERDAEFTAAEVAGLLRAVDSYRAAKGLPAPKS